MRSRSGWFGDSKGHALAAKGVTFRRKVLSDPQYFAHRREMQVPFDRLRSMVAEGLSYDQMLVKLKGEDPEDIRKRGMLAVEMRNADGMLGALDKNGVDTTVKMAEESVAFKRHAVGVLRDRQSSSFLRDEKRDELKKRLGVY